MFLCEGKNRTIRVEIASILIFGIFSSITKAEIPHLQAIHVLDPDIEDFKYYASWNSDQWIQWVRQRYVQDLEGRRNKDDDGQEIHAPLYGIWVNIILISNSEDINSAFTETSNLTYPDDPTRADYRWSDVAFPSYVVVRKVVETKEIFDDGSSDGTEVPDAKKIQYNVHNCSGKKMFINAKLDPVSFNPILIQTLFPKKVKNPQDKLRIPLLVCSKVGQVRGLLDEIRFQLSATS